MSPRTSLLVGLMLACFMVETNSSTEIEGARSRVLSRRRRYVTFPDGASFSCAVCLTVGVIGQPALETFPGLFVLAVNWGIAYELPNETDTLAAVETFNRLKRPVAMRRSRRDLYGKMETIMDNMGYNGRECILKTLCETTQRILPRRNSMLEEIFRTIFTLPKTNVFSSEPPEHVVYDAAHRKGVKMEPCDEYNCPLSLVDLIKGYYNAPAPNYDASVSPLSYFSQPFG